jgi:hypothetical protein
MSEEEQNQDQKKALLTLAIELGDKKKQLLNIYLDSKPEQLAYDFCLQNNLDFDSMQNLTEEIKNALSNYKNDPNLNLKNQISEEAEQNTSNKKSKKINEYEIGQISKKEEKHEIDQENEEFHQENEDKSEHENLSEQKNKEKESGPKTEEISEEQHEQIDNQAEIHNKDEKGYNSEEHEVNQEHESRSGHEIEHEEHLEEKDKMKENSEGNENKEDNHTNNENNTANSNNLNENKKEENEEELAKEEAGDEMMDMNENEEDDAIPSYLSPTICFQYKQRQIAQPKPKPEFSDFDTSYKKKDKTKEFVAELHEKVVNHLDINQNNQKYLPKDYYDNPDGKNFGERLYQKELKLKEEAMEKIKNKIERENKSKEENLTFAPKINDYNIVTLQKRKNNKQQYK